LGNATNTILSSTEADLQVTLKTFIIPNINEDEVKKNLAGKKLSDAQKVLGSLNNIKGYDLHVSPNIPFFDSVPKNVNQIEIVINKN